MSRAVRQPSHTPRRAAAAVMLFAVTPGLAAAGGFYVQEQSVKGAGRAYSGEVADRGADSLWWNPAAIARSGSEAYVGVHGRFLSSQAVDRGSDITRPIPPVGLTLPVGGMSDPDEPMQDSAIPNGAVAIPVSDRVTLGVSATRPFVFETEYPESAWARYDTIHARITTTDLQATAAVQVNEWLDLGVGVSAQYTDAVLNSASPNLSPLDPDALSSLEGDGWNYGWTVGAQAEFDRLSVGASYRSAVEQELDSRIALSGLRGPLAAANFDTAGVATFTTPWIAVVGARFRITPRLAANLQAQRFGWSEYDAIRVRFLGQTQAIDQHYRDTTSIALGADYELSPQLTLRAGVQAEETPTRDELREPGPLDSDRKTYGVGASWKVAPNVTLDGAFSYLDYDKAPLHEDAVFYGGTPAQTTVRLRGDYKASGQVASVGLRWRF